MADDGARERGKIVRREVLDHAARPLLVELLTPFASFFDRHGVRLDDLAKTSQEDRALVARVHALVHDDGAIEPPPDDLVELLALLDALATSDAADALIRYDTERRLPRGTHGDVDLGLIALLRHPELAELVAAATAREPEHKFAEYAPARTDLELGVTRPALAKLAKVLGARLAALDHTDVCRPELTKNRWYVELEIVHGSRPKTRDTIDPASRSLAQITDVTARRSFARIDRRTGRLFVRAYPRVREEIRRAFGEVLADDGDFYSPAGLYDLSVFKDVDAALAPESPVKRVELRMISMVAHDGVSSLFKRGRADLLVSSSRPIIEMSLRGASPIAVRIYLDIGGSRMIRVELAADGKRNVIDYNRDDPEVRRIVERFLQSRGIMRAPAALAAELEDAPGATASA